MPQVVVNKRKCKEAIEGLELSREIAKQMLSSRQRTFLVSRCTIEVRKLVGSNRPPII
jgi:hypothetical protein